MSNTKTPAQREAKALARAEYEAEGIRRAKARRRIRNQRPKTYKRNFTCDMGYYECELRGYCNGDC